MKKASLVLDINVPDDYETGDCAKCPLCSKSYYSTYSGDGVSETFSCRIECTRMTCPVVVSRIVED